MTTTASTPAARNVAAQWFKASESLGDFMGIRYGRLNEETNTVDWQFVSHVECDGIGGFARILRSQGARLPALPTTRHSCRGLVRPLWHRLWHHGRPSPCATRNDWTVDSTATDGPPTDVSWRIFSEQETRAIATYCRQHQVTVNSLLLKHLDTAVRPELGIASQALPWMIPVNLRGDIHCDDDTANHVSCIDAIVAPDDTPRTLQEQIARRLNHGEHRANYLLMQLGGCLTHHQKKRLLARDRIKPHGHIGAFSNLGAWPQAAGAPQDDCWLFCPPVVAGQRLSAGCLTYRNRLSLVIQSHAPESSAGHRVDRWAKQTLAAATSDG